ncbi:MAG: site-2 protease family protein [Candidatus Sungbacteria bacterium]|nr:site-2 protease family protein [Candidatus Sungbacteria bacterium]
MSLLIFIVVLGVIVLVHEWGHFFAAKKFGIRVDEFGFGFPPRILSKMWHGTLYSLNLFPLGGFVKIYGEGGEGQGSRESFASHSILRRTIIIAAGVFMNLVLAWFLFSLGHIVGAPALAGESNVENINVMITGVVPKSPAAEAHLAFGNVIREIKFENEVLRPQNTLELVEFVNRHRGKSLTLSVLPSSVAEENELKSISITGRENPPPGEGSLGIALSDMGITRSPWYLAPLRGLESLWFSVKATVYAIGDIFQSAVKEQKIPEGVSGPLGLFALTGQTQRLGFSYFIQFIALLSVNLAVLNIIPFPALDGGRILFLVIEKVRGRPVHFEYERIVHTLGFLLLLALILIISYHDVRRFFL